MHDIFTSPKPAKSYPPESFVLKRMVLSPAHWQMYGLPENLDWKPVQFHRSNLPKVPDDQKGVYTFVIQPGIANHPHCAYLMYVGMVKDQSFRDRFAQYLDEQRAGENSRRVHVTELLCKWDGFLWFCFAPMKDQNRIEPMEDALLAAYLPPSNRRFPAKVKRHVAKLFSQ